MSVFTTKDSLDEIKLRRINYVLLYFCINLLHHTLIFPRSMRVSVKQQKENTVENAQVYNIRTPTHTHVQHIVIHAHIESSTYAPYVPTCAREGHVQERDRNNIMQVCKKGMGVAGRAIQQINTSGGDRQPVSLPLRPGRPAHPAPRRPHASTYIVNCHRVIQTSQNCYGRGIMCFSLQYVCEMCLCSHLTYAYYCLWYALLLVLWLGSSISLLQLNTA